MPSCPTSSSLLAAFTALICRAQRSIKPVVVAVGVDLFGSATVQTGRGNDVVVRDGHRGDTVVCRGAGRKRILADPGDRIVGTVSGSADAVGARACPAGSRVITTGPTPAAREGVLTLAPPTTPGRDSAPARG
jgi:hypothetical protein